MEGRENARVTRTKHQLAQALKEMLQEMPIHAVTVRDLCARAGVNRTTFYNHFENQYDLLEAVCQRFLQDISERLAEADPENQASVQEQVTRTLAYLEEHLEYSRLLLDHEVVPNVAERLFFLPKVVELQEVFARNCPDEQRRKAIISFMLFGSFRLLMEWLNAEERVSPQEEAALILLLARRVCSRDFGFA